MNHGIGSPRLKSGGISLTLNLPTWSEPCRKAQKKQMLIVSSSAYFLVRPAGFEPAAYGFEVRRSIQLSYGRISDAPKDHLLCCPSFMVTGGDQQLRRGPIKSSALDLSLLGNR